MAGRFHRAQAGLRLRLHMVLQRFHPGPRVAKLEGFAALVALAIQNDGFMPALADVNTDKEHGTTSALRTRSGASSLRGEQIHRLVRETRLNPQPAHPWQRAGLRRQSF
jgi:hypothetical protein